MCINKGNCSSLVFTKFGKGKVCVSLCVFCGKVGWEKVERVRRREGGRGGKRVYLFVSLCR